MRVFTLLLCLFVSSGALASSGKKAGNCVGAGPQAPRDVSKTDGANKTTWSKAPPTADMNLCNVHFHRSAEHKSAAFKYLVGKGGHKGYSCKASGGSQHGGGGHGDKNSCANTAMGDTVEVHWVYTTCDVKGGPTLGSCLNPNCGNPQLRVEARVFTVSKSGPAFTPKAPPSAKTVEYLGSTTGTNYDNHVCSPYQVTWSVDPTCNSVSKSSLDKFCSSNKYKEKHAHGVRPLVTPKGLLSKIH